MSKKTLSLILFSEALTLGSLIVLYKTANSKGLEKKK